MTGMRAIYAASLAKRGFEGPRGLLEGPYGLERMFGQPIHVDWDDPSLKIVNQTVLGEARGYPALGGGLGQESLTRGVNQACTGEHFLLGARL
jgi:hypothetical protein